MTSPIPSPPSLRPPQITSSALGGLNMSGGSLDEYARSINSPDPATSSSAPGGAVGQDSIYRNISDFELPKDEDSIRAICRYLSIQSSVHKSYVFTMSMLPITDPAVRSTNPTPLKPADRWNVDDQRSVDTITRELNDFISSTLRLKRVNQEVGVQYWTYSSAVVALHFPFKKILVCPKCGHQHLASGMDYRFSNYQFQISCDQKGCGYHGGAQAYDEHLLSEEGIKLEALDMINIRTIEGHAGDIDVYYLIPRHIEERLRKASEDSQRCDLDRDFIESVPQVQIEAIAGRGRYQGFFEGRKVVKLRKESYFLMRGPGHKVEGSGLPYPELLASLKYWWITRKMDKAQEVICDTRILPLSYFYPEASAKSGNLFELIHVGSFMDVIRSELREHDNDKGYKPVFPFPVGNQVVGGEGKSLMLSTEIRVYLELVCAALNFPLEFAFGGLSYSGSDISIRQMEKKFEDFRESLLEMNRWALNRISFILGWPKYRLEHQKFHLGDDLPRINLLAGLKQQMIVGAREVAQQMGFDLDVLRASVQDDVNFEGRVNSQRMKADSKAQQEMATSQQVAAAEGQVHGKEALLEESANLAERVASDAKLLAFVQNSPSTAAEIFGEAAPIVQHVSPNQIMAQTPTVPVPGQEAPSSEASLVDQPPRMSSASPEHEEAEQAAGAGTGGITLSPRELRRIFSELDSAGLDVDEPAEEPTSLASQVSLSDSEGQDIDSLVQGLTQDLSGYEQTQWPSVLHQIKQVYGIEVSQRVGANALQASALVGQRAHYAKGNRSEANDYG